MKKIVLTAVLAATSWALFAQDTSSRSNGTTGTTGTNGTMNNNTTTNQQMSTNGTQGTYQNGTLNNNSNATNLNNNNTTSGQMYNSNTNTSNYSAYGIPNYVQSNFQSQHPNVSNLAWTTSTADFYHGYYSDPTTGRYTHVYYSTDPYYNSQYYPERVTGYTVSLPVLETWVPDQVVTTALNQYKQNLYDIAAMKGNNSTNMYVVRVIDNGELKSMYMDSTGGAVTDYIRTEEQTNMGNGTMNSGTMNNGNLDNGNTNMNNSTNSNSSMSNDTNGTMDNSSTGTTSDMNNTNTDVKKKTKTTMSDGSQIKTKTKNGKTSTKTSGSTSGNNQF
jgi:hypothetical protein